jgi:hypothetical protein
MRLQRAIRIAAVAAVSAAAVIGLSPVTATASPATNLILWTDAAGGHTVIPVPPVCYNISGIGVSLSNQTSSYTVHLYGGLNCAPPPLGTVPAGGSVTNVYFRSFMVS